MNALEIEQLRVSVRPHFWSKRQTILHGIDLAVKPGEIFGFLGPNGSGKTTTIKAVLGLWRPDSGNIRLFGEDAKSDQTRKNIGFLPERPYFSEHMKATEVVTTHGVLAGLTLHEAKKQSEELLERVGLGNAMHRRLSGYSKGMLQRTGLAQSMAGSPKLVIMDEPMSGLDPLGRRDVREIMLLLRDEGKTVFFSTHILPDAESICDRVAIVLDGRVRKVGPLEDLIDRGEERLDIAVAGCSAELEKKITPTVESVERTEAATLFVVKGRAEANQVMDEVRKSSAEIQSVHAHGSSLEDLFVQLASESQKEAA